MTFPTRLKQVRQSLKLTQAEMAVQCGVSLSGLQRYEKGSSFPSVDFLDRIARLGVNLHWLVTGTFADHDDLSLKTVERLMVADGVVCIAFRSNDFHDIKITLEQAGMSLANLHFIMEKHLCGVVDGLKHLNNRPF
jgi:transcriptional regulator with XRE-family HTH domain